MGLCSSSEKLSNEERARRADQRKKNKELDGALHDAHSTDQQINKLLLLGAGESGKSTLFKQMITIYGKGYDLEQRKTFTRIIYNNIISSMKTLCFQSGTYGPPQGDAAESKKIVDELKGEEKIDEALGAHLIRLWNDAGIKKTFDERCHYQLTDSTKYFCEKLAEVMKPDYIPNAQDVLRSRVRTTGIVENEFVIEGNNFKMFDVGGQRNERKKWIHCFQDVTAVLFVGAISEYDQVLYEDENMNRVEEALNLFEEICNSRWFKDTSMILFLNKRDLFAEKITNVPLTVCFPDYAMENSYEAGSQYIKEQFELKNRNPDKQIYSHITCATDTDNVSKVFHSVKDIIIRNSLRGAGLV